MAIGAGLLGREQDASQRCQLLAIIRRNVLLKGPLTVC
jgi:hypothetical protein